MLTNKKRIHLTAKIMLSLHDTPLRKNKVSVKIIWQK
jgi:hypothetical protein